MPDIQLLTSNGVDIEKALELFGDISLYNSTLEDFIRDIKPVLEKLKTYKENSDMQKYAIEVHILKSNASYFGFTHLAKLAKQHELESQKNNVFYVVDHYEELINEANKIISLIHEYLGKTLEKNEVSEEIKKDKVILVVDDSNITRSFVQKIFSDQFNVLVATNGHDALQIISNDQNHKIVAVLLDLNMPDMNGFEVLDYFKSNKLFSKIPVSIITSDISNETRNRVFSYGVVDILTKPFNERDIKMVLDKTIYFNEQL